MVKKLSYLIFSILIFLDKIFSILTKRSFLIWFNDFIQERSYKSIKILDKKIKFFCPNQLIKWRIDTYFVKEPETLEWIDSFEKKDNLIFWDIGGNIGLYSIYNSLKNPNSTTIVFEPSSSNLRVLSRNISINNLEKKIKIVPIPLTNKENTFQVMNENDFFEGGALNSFGEKFDFEGNEFTPKMKYNLLGTTMNYLIENSILDVPDYIKIDVDGIEHFILEGGDKFLQNKKVKSLSVEINENFKHQYENVLKLMEKYNFRILHKKHNNDLDYEKSKFNQTFNYIFVKKSENDFIEEVSLNSFPSKSNFSPNEFKPKIKDNFIRTTKYSNKKIRKDLRYNLVPQMEIYDNIRHKFLPYLMFTQTPNFRSKVLNTDDKGFRYNFAIKEKSIFQEIKKEEIILFLGGSAGFGVGSTQDQNTIPGYLEKKHNYNFLNLSGRAYSGFQEILSLLCNIENLDKLNVKKVIIFSGVNDVYLNSFFELKYPGTMYFNSNFLNKMNKDYTFKKKIFINFLKLIDPEYDKYNLEVMNKNNFFNFLLSKNFRESFAKDNDFNKISPENIINRNFIIYRFFKNMFNCEVIFIFQPVLNWCKNETSQEKALSDYSAIYFKERNKHLNEFITENEKFIDITKKISEKNQIKFYDTNEYIKNKKIDNKWLFVDNLHLNDEGYELVSDYISNFIK